MDGVQKYCGVPESTVHRILSQIKAIGRIKDGDGYCDDWLVVKKAIMSGIESTDRMAFSRRESWIGIQHLNEFERWLIDTYDEMFGVRLVLRQSNFSAHQRKRYLKWRNWSDDTSQS